ncbi:MAG: PSD1 and planctomycete cytochrome C domain-containing protein [Acidobacteriota bacterium]
MSLGKQYFYLFWASGVLLAQSPNTPEFFENKIRPILVKNCYSCHTNTEMGNLRLDSAEAMVKGGARRGPAVVPGDPEKSALIVAVRHADADPKFRMPMGVKLRDADIDALTAWVKAGAVWPKSIPTVSKVGGKFVIFPEQKKFWSMLPLRKPDLPAVKDLKWPRTDLDRFVMARLEKQNMKPVRFATRTELIRRASLDLTGLPPTYEEIQAFLKDTAPDAYSKLIDRLLASPHYGERWGRIWLDVARYGEDDYRSLDPMRRGFNPYPNAFLYRDWVIRAFNDDMPYDLFVKSQLAGDLMDEKIRHKTLPGTGFIGLGPWYYDNGSTEVTRADERHDRVDVITRGFLGLTVACARCHDHKYDPIPQTDYYALAGIFANVTYEEYPLAPQSVVEQFRKIEEQIDIKQKMLMEMQTAMGKNLGHSLALEISNYLQGVFEVAGPRKMEAGNVVEARKLDYEILDRWIKYMAKPTKKYPHKDAWQAMMARKPAATAQEAKKVADKFQEDVVAVMLARHELDDENKVIANKALEGTKPKKRTNKPSNFVTNDDFCPGCGLQLKQMPEDQNNLYTDIFVRELSDNDDPNAMMEGGFRNAKPGVLTFRGWALERRVGSESQAQLAGVRKDIEDARKKIDPHFPFLHGIKDKPKQEISELPLALRGDPMNLGEPVPRHFLSVLSEDQPAIFRAGSGRLELAEAILRQPLHTRVIVNRIWKGHFGSGIVDTPSNFGVTGERPTNSELLEYLAANFAAKGQSIKKLHKEIMLSSVYQLSSDNDAANFAKDSANRLYWRHEKQRLDAEQLRDSVLFVSGKLDRSIGGPSSDLKPDFLRRTVYGKVSRYKLDEYLQLFDFPSPSISAEKRFTTTVPQQRLFLLNSDFMQLQAEELASRAMPEPDNRARVRKLFQLIYGRDASENEIKLGLEYIKSEPMLSYEERKKKAKEAGPAEGMRRRGATGMEAAPASEPPSEAAAAAEAPPAFPADFGMGMMGGMRRGPGAEDKPAVYEPTIWGRYAKVLLSSSEFLFVN